MSLPVSGPTRIVALAAVLRMLSESVVGGQRLHKCTPATSRSVPAASQQHPGSSVAHTNKQHPDTDKQHPDTYKQHPDTDKQHPDTVPAITYFRWLALTSADFCWLALTCADLRWLPLTSAGAVRWWTLPLLKPMLFQHFSRDLHLAIACKPTIVRVHTFWKIVFLLWSNEISTFFDLLMDQGAHFVTVHAFGSIFGESHFLHWSSEISTILIFRSICMLHRAPIWPPLLSTSES